MKIIRGNTVSAILRKVMYGFSNSNNLKVTCPSNQIFLKIDIIFASFMNSVRFCPLILVKFLLM